MTPRTVAHQASLSFTIYCNLLKLMSIDSVMLCNHLILCLLFSTPFSSCLQSLPASGSFSSESALRIRYPKYWSFSFSISTSNEYSELISLRIDWFDLLAVQGTLKSLFQHHNLKASVRLINIIHCSCQGTDYVLRTLMFLRKQAECPYPQKGAKHLHI